VHVVGDSQKTIDAISKVAPGHGSKVTIRAGKAFSIGTEKKDGNDREQCDDARRSYSAIIQEAQDTGSLGGHDIAGLWKDIRDHWPALQTEFLPSKEAGGRQGVAGAERGSVFARVRELFPSS
jgi:hypothetical protein